MQNEKISQFFEQLKNNWQFFVFGVFLLGYLTFAFYMQINGFAFIVPDLKFLVAFGLIILFLSLPVMLMVPDGHLNIYSIMLFSGIVPMLFQNFTIMMIFMIIAAGHQANSIVDFSSSGQTDEVKKKRNKIINFLLAVSYILFILFLIDWRYALVIFLNITFFSMMEISYRSLKIINPIHIIFYLLSLSYVIAIIIDSKGFPLANMQKTYINFQIENNQSIKGILVFDDAENFYIKDQNKSISIAKDKAINIIQYKHHESEFKSTFNYIKEAF